MGEGTDQGMKMHQRTRGFKHAACEKCGGDAFLDLSDSEWRCLQCGKFLERYTPAQPDAWNALVSSVSTDGRVGQ